MMKLGYPPSTKTSSAPCSGDAKKIPTMSWVDVLSQGSSDDAGSSDVAGHDRPNAGMALEDQGGLRPLKETVKWTKMTK